MTWPRWFLFDAPINFVDFFLKLSYLYGCSFIITMYWLLLILGNRLLTHDRILILEHSRIFVIYSVFKIKQILRSFISTVSFLPCFHLFQILRLFAFISLFINDISRATFYHLATFFPRSNPSKVNLSMECSSMLWSASFFSFYFLDILKLLDEFWLLIVH